MADEFNFSDLTFAEIKKLKVVELKARLTNLGLPVSGLKADLVARLASFLESRAIQAAFGEVKDQKEPGDGDTSTDVLQQPGIAKDKGVLVDDYGRHVSQPYELGGPSHVHTEVPEQVSAVVGEVVTEISANKPDDDVLMRMDENVDVVEPSMESVGDAVKDVIVMDNEKDVRKDAIRVEQTFRGEENTAIADDENQQLEEKVPEIEQKEIEIQEKREIEIQPERGMERIEAPHHIIEPSVRTIEQTLRPAEEHLLGIQHQVEKADEIPDSVAVNQQQQQSISIDQRETHGNILVEAEQYISGSGAVSQEISKANESVTSVEGMETEMIQEGVSEVPTQGSYQELAVTAQTNDVVEDKLSESSSEKPLRPSFELPEETPPLMPHPKSPSLNPPVQAPTLPPPQPSFAPPTHSQSQQASPQPFSLPPNLQSFSHQTSEILSHAPSENVLEAQATLPSKPSTPPRVVPHIETPPKDASPAEPTPQEDIPPKVASPRDAPTLPPTPDPLAEAKAKARSIVEMRERRLNQESQSETRGDDSGYDVDHYEQEGIPAAESRQEKKKKKKKKRKKRNNAQTNVQSEASPDDEGIEVEYVSEALDVKDPVYAQFASIFETFKLSEKPETKKKDEAKEKSEDKTTEAAKKDDDEMDTDSEEEEVPKVEEPGEKVEKLSKKKLKLKNRMSVAELKQTVHRPDVVEMHDVTAPDPKLLVYLKACRNTVPVPRHWCFKRKFLQGKRGIIKPPFQLPEFIQKTGIMEMREALQEKEDAKNMKAKMREKIRPKMGKIDIDYQKLHDAFFKWQTKPKMSIHGDLYYEGKEFETKLKEKKPGDLSEDLRTALGMPTGQGSNLVPPPWLIAMQRYGPPPSYPNLKIPGLNAPIPEGASFGYHAGGWGKPPVDEHGRPLYGDVFGVQQTDLNIVDDELVDSNLWGELESESEESEESEEESEEEAPDQSGLVTPAETGLVTPSGLTSIPAGMETPDMIELRKRKNIEDAMESGAEQPSLYTVLPEKRAGVGGMMMGTSHVYDLATAAAPAGARKAPGGLSEGVEVALDPSELELDPAAMQARYDEQLREQQNTQKEDFSDMVAEHAARQQKKRKKTTESGKAAKKYKEFKF